MTCANKREVLNRAKEILEPYVDSNTIDREDLKTLTKKSVDAVTPPVSVGDVTHAVLQQLLGLLDERGAGEEVVAPLRAALVAAVPSPPEAPAAAAAPSPAPPALSLGALRERMLRKKEELRRARPAAPQEPAPLAGGELAEAGAIPAPSPKPPSSSDGPSQAPAEESTAPAASPTDKRPASVAGMEDERPLLRRRTETPAPLPVTALDEIDIYADLVRHPARM